VQFKRLLPLLTAGMSLFRDAQVRPLADQQQFLLVVCAAFPLAICSIRLLFEERLSRRLVLSSLATFSVLAVAIALMSWQAAHPSRDWSITSNFPGGQQLFLSILACETLALLTVACSFLVIANESEGEQFAQTLTGACWRRPGASIPLLIGLCSLAGIPPFPGFWWRFGLVAGLMLPRRQSLLTRVVEAHGGFTVLVCLLVVLLIINGLGHLRLMQRMLLEEPFRVPSRTAPVRLKFASFIATALLIAVGIIPLSLGAPRASAVQAEPAEPDHVDSESLL
jgi:NADH:ubiquinone oxidoreductase subunit 2 (subunit N)